MVYDVIVTKHNKTYTASVKEWPEVRVKADSRERAIQQVKARLRDYLTRDIEVIQVNVPVPQSSKNLWIETFGWFSDDPTFEHVQAEIAAYRRELDSETAPTTAS